MCYYTVLFFTSWDSFSHGDRCNVNYIIFFFTRYQCLYVSLSHIHFYVFTDLYPHFSEGRATRVMIFSQYRDSVQEIATMLQQHHPQVKVMSFIGQSSVGKATKGFTQKEQLKVNMQTYRPLCGLHCPS